MQWNCSIQCLFGVQSKVTDQGSNLLNKPVMYKEIILHVLSTSYIN